MAIQYSPMRRRFENIVTRQEQDEHAAEAQRHKDKASARVRARELEDERYARNERFHEEKRDDARNNFPALADEGSTFEQILEVFTSTSVHVLNYMAAEMFEVIPQTTMARLVQMKENDPAAQALATYLVHEGRRMYESDTYQRFIRALEEARYKAGPTGR